MPFIQVQISKMRKRKILKRKRKKQKRPTQKKRMKLHGKGVFDVLRKFYKEAKKGYKKYRKETY